MNKTMRLFLLALCLASLSTVLPAADNPAPEATPQKALAGADTLIRQAASQQKYLLLLFRAEENDAVAQLRKTAQEALALTKHQLDFAETDFKDDANKEIIDRFGLRQAPPPVLLVLAPNGAITGGFIPANCSLSAIKQSLAGPKTTACLKLLQDGKVALVCVQSAKSENAEAALKTAAEFKEDKRVSGFAGSVVIDPADPAEKGFLDQLHLNPASTAATTVVLLPPGKIVGTYPGTADKEAMFADITKAMSGSTCGGGAKSSGCCPR